MSMKASDYSCVPLCPECHTRGPVAYHRIGKHAFERVRCLRFASIAARLKREWKRRMRATSESICAKYLTSDTCQQ
jgi:hypothetical protein